MKKNIIISSVYLISLIFIVAGFRMIKTQVNRYNNTERVIYINDGVSSDDKVNIGVSVSKSWEDKDEQGRAVKGAQYDGRIYLMSGETLSNWTIIIRLPQEGLLDSFWNGVFESTDQTITIRAVEFNTVLDEEYQNTFGFVMKSEQLMEINDFEVRGYYTRSVSEHPGYVFLSITGIIWLILFLAYVIAELALINIKRNQKKNEKIIIQTMDTFISFIDAKDPYTHGHSDRVAAYTKELARRLELDKNKQKTYYYIALMHDCGKIGVPDSILNKPGRLSADERVVIEAHTKVGANIVKNFTAIPEMQDGVLHHHERYDGKGYPDGLKGAEISLLSRILCVADSFDAMNSNRCYRKRLTRQEIIKELKDNAGKQFDPQIVAHMIAMIEDGYVKVCI